MTHHFVDLHIHIGQTHSGKPVKITGSKTLTLTNILKTAKAPKGLDIVGVIDCHSPEVIQEIEHLLDTGELLELKEGGLRFQGKVTLIPGVELEVYDQNCQGPIHVLGYFPHLNVLKAFSQWLSKRVTNIQLSSQRIYESGIALQKKIKSFGGLFIPAHVFTPFKSLFGKGVKTSLSEVFDPQFIDGIELGLSSNTEMADGLKELHYYTYLSNSDAHSLPKIAREYQVMQLDSPSFAAIKKALHRIGDNKVIANYGLNPLLGKYYRTTCATCFSKQEKQQVCPACGSKKFIKGVYERILELKTTNKGPIRPPYIHQIPLEFLPGLGPKTLAKLTSHFHTEMNILHDVTEDELAKVVNKELAKLIIQARNGELILSSGGGGHYGKVKRR